MKEKIKTEAPVHDLIEALATGLDSYFQKRRKKDKKYYYVYSPYIVSEINCNSHLCVFSLYGSEKKNIKKLILANENRLKRKGRVWIQINKHSAFEITRCSGGASLVYDININWYFRLNEKERWVYYTTANKFLIVHISFKYHADNTEDKFSNIIFEDFEEDVVRPSNNCGCPNVVIEKSLFRFDSKEAAKQFAEKNLEKYLKIFN